VEWRQKQFNERDIVKGVMIAIADVLQWNAIARDIAIAKKTPKDAGLKVCHQMKRH